MRILVYSNKLPFPDQGASLRDRLDGVKQLDRLGHQIKLVAHLYPNQNPESVRELERKLGIPAVAISVSGRPPRDLRRGVAMMKSPGLLDGMAYINALPEVQSFVEQSIHTWQPDLLWLDHTWSWPLLRLAQKYHLPTVVRSQTFEPLDFWERSGKSLSNGLRFVGKWFGEWMCLRYSDVLAVISPREMGIYSRLPGRRASLRLLPLRSLDSCLQPAKQHKDRSPLKVFFMGSNYDTFHNRHALEMILKKILPELRNRSAGEFLFHIVGRKIPAHFQRDYDGENIRFLGWIEDLEAFFPDMDVALVPTPLGWGMKQKVFEALCRGFPSILDHRAVSGYPIQHGVQALLASNWTDYIESLLALRSVDLRKRLSRAAFEWSVEWFSTERMDRIVKEILDVAVTSHPITQIEHEGT